MMPETEPEPFELNGALPPGPLRMVNDCGSLRGGGPGGNGGRVNPIAPHNEGGGFVVATDTCGGAMAIIALPSCQPGCKTNNRACP